MSCHLTLCHVVLCIMSCWILSWTQRNVMFDWVISVMLLVTFQVVVVWRGGGGSFIFLLSILSKVIFYIKREREERERERERDRERERQRQRQRQRDRQRQTETERDREREREDKSGIVAVWRGSYSTQSPAAWNVYLDLVCRHVQVLFDITTGGGGGGGGGGGSCVTSQRDSTS